MSLSEDRHQPRCGRCGAPTRPQVIKGMTTDVCVACGAVTVDQRTLERLAGATARPAQPDEGLRPVPLQPTATPPRGPGGSPPPWQGASPPRPTAARSDETTAQRPASHLGAISDEEFDRQLAMTRAARRRRTTALGIAAATLLAVLLLAVPVGYGLTWGARSLHPSEVGAPSLEAALRPNTGSGRVVVETEGSTPAAGADDASSEGAATRTDALVSDPGATGDQGAAGSRNATGEAGSDGAGQPEEAPRPSGFQVLLRRGWDRVGGDPVAAAAIFRQALDQRPASAEASYGYGYALLKQGDPSAARPFLCAALSGGDLEVTRDVSSLLAQNSLACD